MPGTCPATPSNRWRPPSGGSWGVEPMMMSPTALIDTGAAGALLGAPAEVDNGASGVRSGVRPVAADVPSCPPAVVHAPISHVKMSSTATRRRRDGRLANPERRAASMLLLCALADDLYTTCMNLSR